MQEKWSWKHWIKIGFPVSCVWIGAQVGPALAAGTTAATYFAKFGSIGIWSALISQLACAYFIFFGLEIGRVYKIRNYKDSYLLAWGRIAENKVVAKILTIVNDILTIVAACLTSALMFSMMGVSVISQLTGCSPTVGLILTALIFLVVIMWGLGVMKAISTILTIMLVVCFALLYFLGLSTGTSDPAVFTRAWNLPMGFGPAAAMCWAYIGIQYGTCKSCCMYTDKFNHVKDSWITAIVGALINTLFLVVSTLNLWYFYPEALEQNAPHLWIILNYYPTWTTILYYATSVAACISTAAAVLIGITRRFVPVFFKSDSKVKPMYRDMIVSSVLMVICAFVSLAGMTTIMGKYYSMVGTLALILGIVPYGIIFPIKYFRTPKEERERLAARDVA